jgi:hypothetical protein
MRRTWRADIQQTLPKVSFNDTLHLSGPLVKHGVAKNRNAAAVRLYVQSHSHPSVWSILIPRSREEVSRSGEALPLVAD